METKEKIYISSPKKFHQHEKFIIDKTREGHILVASGTYYDIGKIIGQEFGKILKEEIESSYKSIKYKIEHWLKKTNLDAEIETALHKFAKNIPLECQAEMQGIYDGCREAGFPLADSQLLQKLAITIELGEQECTLFAAQPPMTSGHTLHLRDLDYYPHVNMHYIPTLLVRIPQDGNGKLIDCATASFDFISNMGGMVTGINEHGVSLGQSRGPFLKRFSYEGVPITFLIHKILTHAKNSMEAIEIIKKYPPATAHFVIVSDPQQKKESLQLIFMGPELLKHVTYDQKPEISLIEYPDENLRFYEPIDGIVYWTDMVDRKVNHVNIDFNMIDIYQLLKKYKNNLTVPNALEIAKISGNDITFISALFDSTDLAAWVAFSTRTHAAQVNEYRFFDLKKYFKLKEKIL